MSQTSTKPGSYASSLRKAMSRKGLNIRDLERLMSVKNRGFSYEHIRRVLGGLPFMSQSFNEVVCEALGLSPQETDQMWEMAQSEKALRKPGGDVKIPDSRLASFWSELMQSDHDKLVKIAEGMVEERRLQRIDGDLTNEQIRQRIHELTDRLTIEEPNPRTATKRQRLKR